MVVRFCAWLLCLWPQASTLQAVEQRQRVLAAFFPLSRVKFVPDAPGQMEVNLHTVS